MAGCPLEMLISRSIRSLDDLRGININHLLDWPRGEFAACLFGANEPPGRLLTSNHEHVIIDSEQMFATGPCELTGTTWLRDSDDAPSSTARALALEVCRDLSMLTMHDIECSLRIPVGVEFHQPWSIEINLKESWRFSAEYCATGGTL